MITSGEDEALLRELRAALDEASGADELARVGREVWVWRDPEARLAELVADSAVDAPAADVRGAGGLRTLRFDSGAVSIEVELVDGRLRGLALSPGAATVELHTRAGLAGSAPVEPTGWFELTLPAEARAASTLLRLRLLDDTGDQTWTAWFRT